MKRTAFMFCCSSKLRRYIQKVLPGGEEAAARIIGFTAGLPMAGARGRGLH
jgi:hypothetical protein